MCTHFSPDNGTSNPLRNERGNTTRVLLLVLLLVVAAGGYVYYFTDLIRPTTKAPAPPAPQAAQVKKPIPPRPEQQGQAPASPEGAKQQKANGPSPASSSAAAPVAPAPPANPTVAQKPAPVKTEPVKIAKADVPAKPAPAPATGPVKAAPAKTVPAPAKPAVPPSARPKNVAAQAKSAEKLEKQPVRGKKKGAYVLLVGDFVPGRNLDDAVAKVKRHGIASIRKGVITAAEPMNRLQVGVFTDQEVAEAELQQVRNITPDAFLIANNGSFTLYAGSYFTQSRLGTELHRLQSKGLKPVVKKVKIPVKMARLFAGSYADNESARNDAQKLKKVGLSPRVVKAGKKL